MARELIFRTAETSWWDAVDMRDGTRRVLRRGLAVQDGLAWTTDPVDGDVAWSGKVAYSLAELLPVEGEAALAGDAALVAGIAVAGLRALAEGRLNGGTGLAARVVCIEGALRVVGGDVPAGAGEGAAGAGPAGDEGGSSALAALLREVDAEDTFGLVGLLASGVPVEPRRFLVAAFAAFLAHERHVITRRVERDRRLDALAALRALAHRLARALPPPGGISGEVRCDGGRVFAPDGAAIWDGVTLDARRARTAARALAGVAPEPAIRRWIVAMSRLRVDREILGRRG